MKKDKLYKIEENEQKMIEAFRLAVSEAIGSGAYVSTYDIEETHKKEGYRIDAVLDYGDFRARLFYNPCYLLTDYLDVELELGGRYRCSVYDVFNLLDIDDFNQYYYSCIELDSNMKKYVIAILDMLNKYSYDIKRAAEPANAAAIDANIEADYKRVFSKDSEENWRGDMDNPLRLNMVHPYFTSVSSATDSERLLKKMKKQSDKDNLDTLYERRLLAYLEKGNTVVNEAVAENKDNEKRYAKAKGVISIGIFVAVLLVFIAIALINRMSFSGAYIPTVTSTIAGVKLPISPESLIPYAFTVLPLSFGLIGLLSKPLLRRLTNNDESVMQSYEKDVRDNTGNKLGRVLSRIMCIFGIVIGISMGLFVFNNTIGFYDDSVKFNTGLLFSTVEVSNEDVRIVRILGEYDADNNYVEYTDSESYVIIAEDNQYHQLDSLSPDGKTSGIIKGIIKSQNGKVEEYKDFTEFDNAFNPADNEE